MIDFMAACPGLQVCAVVESVVSLLAWGRRAYVAVARSRGVGDVRRVDVRQARRRRGVRCRSLRLRGWPV